MVNKAQLYEQLTELRLSFPKLHLKKDGEGSWLVEGLLTFSAEYSGQLIEDEYSIEIVLPEEYPDRLPKARETGNRIPLSFHRYSDGSLCLGAPLAVKKKFAERPTLSGFVINCVVPYLYSYSYVCRYGELPYGELSHGGQGILEFYQDLFALKDVMALLGLVKILADDNYRGHVKCPCGSGKRLRSCHGTTLLEIKELQPAAAFLAEYVYMVNALTDRDPEDPSAVQRQKLWGR